MFQDHASESPYITGFLTINKGDQFHGMDCDKMTAEAFPVMLTSVGGLGFAGEASLCGWDELQGVNGDAWVVGFSMKNTARPMDKSGALQLLSQMDRKIN